MTSGKSKITAKTRVLAKNDLDRFLALHVTATADMYLQQLAHEVRRGHAAEERVKNLELKLMEADTALNRAMAFVNERDHAIARCNLEISDLAGEIGSKDKELMGLRNIIKIIRMRLALLQTKMIALNSHGSGQCLLLAEIRLTLMNSTVRRSFITEWADRFDGIVEKNNEANELFDNELRELCEFCELVDKINCT